ncbi:VOC family protein [Pedobacter miscanthi]|uniref:VOC family protein n=1 Tax=Pedobacter miscanthi TaxID=2259170 RepID=A0A366L7Y0_9SPHI|nr:VOC family protein [Pedobacter miscanthi]RBQ09958.1 VOC family protein [Pedobacter miscanthi]
MLKLNLDTIILFVQDVTLLKSFYVDILELEILEETRSEWLLLKAGNCNIALHKIGDQYKSKEPFKSDSNTKLVFEVDDINAVRDYLLSEKTLINEIKTFPDYNYWLCDGEDPEGNVFQLKQRK